MNHGGDIVEVDAADGEEGNFQDAGGLADEGEAGDPGVFRRGREGSADADVIGGRHLRRDEVVDAVSGNADEAIRADDAAGGVGGQIVRPDVDAVGAGKEGDIGAVVHDEKPIAGGVAAEAGALEKERIGERFLAQLDAVGAAGEDFADESFEGKRGNAVGQEDGEADAGEIALHRFYAETAATASSTVS